MSLHQFAGDFLTFLERKEESLLHWGFHDLSNSSSDLEEALEKESSDELKRKWQELKDSGTSFRALLRKMRQNNLLYQLPDKPDEYRTRMAETLRLLGNLRQRFSNEDWATAPKLVSDIKIHLRDREYPKRDIPAEDIWDKELSAVCSDESKDFIKECFDALSQDGNGHAFEFSGFQNRSFGKIFAEYNTGKPTASVVCAGTGSGKTKSFYVPAFLRVAEEVLRDDRPFVKIIALYPRNVLLADQLKEAISETLKLNPILGKHGKRPITFGALLGSTPWKKWFNPPPPGQTSPSWHWETRDGGHVIPHLCSPVDEGSDLIWKEEDRENGRNALYRSGQNNPDVPDGVLKITREELVRDPPDVLFLSLEMLNRELSNPYWNKSFGINQGDLSPRLVLLDEVHTHEGISGANAAWVLRRWKYFVRRTGGKFPHFVGLSATLREAAEHMGRVVGVLPDNVAEFSPREKEMEKEGQEYNLAIKGDPSSGTALLSTSIQVGMLLARSLTPRNQQTGNDIESQKLFLRKVFGFTDNLDSLNRWFSNMRDAEYQRLAQFRIPPNPDPGPVIFQRIRDEGQLWELPGKLGYKLDEPLDVSRCSSQDPGANSGSDLILATASLEVGFDDPEVGMVLHHKAPSSMSSFIQRKGRAGRVRGSRPWTVVVLSDYGRDRWAFQSAERLFKPEVDRIALPISNPYVLRVQLSAFLVDWLGQKISTGSAFGYLSKTSSHAPSIRAQEDAIVILRDFLEQGEAWKQFNRDAMNFLAYGQGVFRKSSESEKRRMRHLVEEILWEEPRPLILEVIPALLRKLEVKWEQSGPSNELEDKGCGRPIPQSIPKATFEELDLSEALIEFEDYKGKNKEDELLPIPQFLRETCIGRVSKRFSTLRGEPGFWQEKSAELETGVNSLPIDSLYGGKIALKQINGMQIFRPSFAKVIHVDPKTIIESSSSSWDWKLSASAAQEEFAEPLPLSSSKPWDKIILRFDALLHVNGSWIEMIRHARKCTFETRFKKEDPKLGTVELKDSNGADEAIGFQLNADGLFIEIDQAHLNEIPQIDDKLHSELKYEYFLDQIKSDENLENHLNVFRADWMAQISMAMLCATATRKKLSLQDAQRELRNKRPQAAEKVLETIFQMRGIGTDGSTEDSRLKENLMELWENPSVVQEIERIETCLWKSIDQDFEDWLRERHLASLAQSFKSAASQVSEQVGEEDLSVDVMANEGNYFILITEKSSGGLGQIQSIASKIKEDPRFYLDAVEHSLGFCPRESWAQNLFVTTKCAHRENRMGKGKLYDSFKEIRNSGNFSGLDAGLGKLVEALRSHGIDSRREQVTAVTMKLLRRGSNESTDALTFALNGIWRKRSQSIGLEIPIRTFAYLATSFKPSKRRITSFFKREYGSEPEPAQLYATIQQLLFEGCTDSCPDCLNNPNQFTDFGKPARNLSLQWLSLGVEEVEVTEGSDNWSEEARRILSEEGRVCVVATNDCEDLLTKHLQSLYFEEVETGNYCEPVHVQEIRRTGGKLLVFLQIRDFIDA